MPFGADARAQLNAILWDDDGNPIGIIPDTDDANVKRVQVETAFKPGEVLSVIPGAAPLNQQVTDLLKSSGSGDMVVNGSGTPVVFTFMADATDDLVLVELRVVFTASAILWGGDFGKGGGLLTNGILIEAFTDDNVTPVTLINLRQNEDLLRFATQQALTEFGGLKDVVSVSYAFNGTEKLIGASATDKIQVTVRDNLGIGSRGIDYLTMTLHAHKEA